MSYCKILNFLETPLSSQKYSFGSLLNPAHILSNVRHKPVDLSKPSYKPKPQFQPIGDEQIITSHLPLCISDGQCDSVSNRFFWTVHFKQPVQKLDSSIHLFSYVRHHHVIHNMTTWHVYALYAPISQFIAFLYIQFYLVFIVF